MLCCMVTAATESHAFNISVGASSWFSWWEPFWLKKKGVFERSDFNVNPGLLYGPILTLELNEKIHISSIFFFGQFKMKGYRASYLGEFNYSKISTYIMRYDSDTFMTYSILEYIKLIAGFKFLEFQYEYKQKLYYSSLYFTKKVKNKFDEYCPAAGLSVSVPIIKDVFYLIISQSVLYAMGYTFSMDAFELKMPWRSPDKMTNRIGLNSGLNLSVMFKKVNIALTFGGRYQYFHIVKSNRSVSAYGSKDDHFAGINASFVYMVF